MCDVAFVEKSIINGSYFTVKFILGLQDSTSHLDLLNIGPGSAPSEAQTRDCTNKKKNESHFRLNDKQFSLSLHLTWNEIILHIWKL